MQIPVCKDYSSKEEYERALEIYYGVYCEGFMYQSNAMINFRLRGFTQPELLPYEDLRYIAACSLSKMRLKVQGISIPISQTIVGHNLIVEWERRKYAS